MMGKLTLPPLPSLNAVATALIGARPTIDSVTAPWRGDAGRTYLFARSAWAMKAMARAAEKRFGRPPQVWLPDYFCNDAALPLRDTGAEIRHYPITESLEPDWATARAMADAEAPDLFYLVHYFGFPADAQRAKALCTETGALLIEDAAHALGPGAGIGAHGDAVFYSPHKLLAVPDGAVLRIGDGGDALTPDIGGTEAPSGPWLAKRLMQVLAPARMLERRAAGRAVEFMSDAVVGARPERPRMDARSLRMLAAAATTLAAVAAARKANARQITAAAAALPGWTPLVPEGDDWVPYRVVMRCESQAVAEARFAALQRSGCPVESWPDLAPEVAAAPQRHAAAHALRRTVLLLPVHQTLDAEKLCRRLAECGAGG